LREALLIAETDVLEVSGLRDPKIHKGIIDTLVMKPESNKQLIKAVCETFGGTYTQAFSSDFIQGKGEEQILLLHGPPGTGKTLTAGIHRSPLPRRVNNP
jgi:SpoVK/Ycf46/Vps4 family AAA+-type ATPase